MRVASFTSIGAVLALGVVSLAAPRAASAQMGGGQPMTIGIAMGIQRGYNAVKQNILEAAEKMPEANYKFEPNPDIRNFGELFGHIANAQFNTCALVLGKPNPNQGKDQELENKTKAEYQAALKASFDLCDEAYAGLTEANATDMLKQGQNQVARAVLLSNNVAHNNEMYGTTAVYMRLKNLVPPSTERQTRSRR